MGESEFHFSPRPNRAHEIKWRGWSEEAFAEAGKLDRPILLSISAVWCHWCHVMDETTYSNSGVIDLINREYVPIRVDNDVRPDNYQANRPEIANRVLEGRKRAGSGVARSAGTLADGSVDEVVEAVKNAYDPEYGGFGSAPKFPQTDAILLLLEQAQLDADQELRAMATHTLEMMAAGGTYDHVEGGFFRYSTTQDWSVPHFEKMLEDHAGLVNALALAGLQEALDTTTGYLDRVLRDPVTGLYAGSQDADEHYYALDARGRAQAHAPYVDRRIYTSWNAALAIAYLDAAARCERPALRDHAAVLLGRLFKDRYQPGAGLAHSDGVIGQLPDQVWGLWAAVRAHQAGLGGHWLTDARDIAQHLEDQYADPELGGYFDHAGAEQLGRLGERIKPLVENSIATMALVELDELVGDPDQPYAARARRALESVAALPRQYGLMASVFARALDRLRHTVKVSTGNPQLARAALLAHPYAVIEPNDDERAVVCVGTICLAPVSTPAALGEAIQEASQTRA